MVSPAHKKEAVEHVVRQRLCSVRRACRYLGLSRSTYRYRPRPLAARQQQLHERIVALSWQCPRYGYRRIRALLSAEGWPVSQEKQAGSVLPSNRTLLAHGRLRPNRLH